jgi:hypothetical protein
MAGEADRILRVVDEPIINDDKSDFKMESDVPMTSSSSNVAAAKMAEKTTLKIVDYWKKMTVTEANRQCNTLWYELPNHDH